MARLPGVGERLLLDSQGRSTKREQTEGEQTEREQRERAERESRRRERAERERESREREIERGSKVARQNGGETTHEREQQGR